MCLTYRNMIASAFDSLDRPSADREGCLAARRADVSSCRRVVDLVPATDRCAPGRHSTSRPKRFMDRLQATRATATGLPPTLISMMANHPKIREYDLSSLRFIMYGGSPTPLGILQSAVKAIDTTYIHGYGITETSGITTLAHPDDFNVVGSPEKLAMTASAGRAVPTHPASDS